LHLLSIFGTMLELSDVWLCPLLMGFSMQYSVLEIEGFSVRVPVGSMDPPCEFGEMVFGLVRNESNWKLATSKFKTTDIDKVNAVGYCLDWYLGGHEVEATVKNGVVEYAVWSKGYYHHIGA